MYKSQSSGDYGSISETYLELTRTYKAELIFCKSSKQFSQKSSILDIRLVSKYAFVIKETSKNWFENRILGDPPDPN